MSADAPHVDCCEIAGGKGPANKRVFMVSDCAGTERVVSGRLLSSLRATVHGGQGKTLR